MLSRDRLSYTKYLRLIGRLVPLEEEPEGDVVGVGGELPKEGGAVVVGGYADGHGLSMADLLNKGSIKQIFRSSISRLCDFVSFISLREVDFIHCL